VSSKFIIMHVICLLNSCTLYSDNETLNGFTNEVTRRHLYLVSVASRPISIHRISRPIIHTFSPRKMWPKLDLRLMRRG